MANYATLKSAIRQVIKTNENNEITGALLQQSLLAMINSLGVGYQYMGMATPSTNPGTPDQNVFYFATEAGTYSNFGGVVLTAQKLAILCWDGTWHLDSVQIGGLFIPGDGTNSAQLAGTGAKANGPASVAEGGDNLQGGEPASGEELLYSKAEGYASHAEGAAHAVGIYSHAEGGGDSIVEGKKTVPTAEGSYSHAEGSHTYAKGSRSHAEGLLTEALGDGSHAEGYNTTASGYSSHAEGDSTTASGDSSHAEGDSTTASGYSSHAEGANTEASGDYSHAEGSDTTASGYSSHAEGNGTEANGDSSHAEGNNTEATNFSEHAEGQYNKSNKSSNTYGNAGNTQHSVGIGTDPSNRKNAFEVMQNGDIYVIGLGGYDGTNPGADGVLTLQQLLASL